MYKIAGKRIDFLDDAELAKSAEFRALTDVHLHSERHEDLPDGDFALVLQGVSRHPKFPVYNKVAASISLTDFGENAESVHPFFRAVAATFLKKAAVDYGLNIPEAVHVYSIEGVTDNRVDLRQMADDTLVESMDKSARLERMEQFWLNNERVMTLEELNEKANRVVKLAGDVGRTINERIWSYATKPKTGPRFKVAVIQRVKVANQLGKPEMGIEYEEAVKGVKTAAEAVQVLRTLDEKHGMSRYYGTMADPYLAAYGGQPQVKQAVELGLRYKLETLAAQHDYELSDVLSTEGLALFRTDPVGTYKNLPEVVQQYIRVKFEHEMKEKQTSEIQSHESEAKLKKRISNLEKGEREHKDIYKIEDKEKKPKFPGPATLTVGEAVSISPAKHTPEGTGAMSVNSRE